MDDNSSDLKWALSDLAGRLEAYRLAQDYYEGRHRLAFASDKFRSAFGSLLRAFADNLCAAVVDTVADRLQVIGFDTEQGDSSNLAAAAWALWQDNRMDRRAGEVHQQAFICGDAYAIVWPDSDGRPVIYPNQAAQVTVAYDPEMPGKIVRAAKTWLAEDKRLRLTLYYPDRIEKYATPGPLVQGLSPELASRLIPFEVPGEPWPLPNPYGVVPVFHFANGGIMGGFGRSELADIVPLQDGLNKAVADMLVAMEFVALPQRWITGLEVEIDETTGKPKAPFVPGADRVWTIGDPDAQLGQFAAADLSQFLAVQDSFRMEIARVSGIPLHYLSLRQDYPSGEAMKTAEARLTAKVRDRQIAWGNVWEDAMMLALRMAGLSEEAHLSTLWQDTAPRSEREFLEGLLLKQQIGASNDALLREAGYSPEQIEQMHAEVGSASSQLGDRLLAAFNQGNFGQR